MNAIKLKLYMYTQRTPKEILTPANWHLIGRSITTAPRLLLLSSWILPPPWFYCAVIPERKNAPRVL